MIDNEVLRLKNISAGYDREADHVISDINFSVYEGEFILLTGLSGCGKSTLLKVINGILSGEEKVKGEIFVNGTSCTNLSPTERSLFIGSVLQNADEQIIYEKVEDELAFPLENLKKEPEEILKTIKYFSEMMEIDIYKSTATLSGGQKQRLITAATLGMKQKILVFDEPLANLDNKGAIKLLENLKTLCKEKGYSVIFAEHRIDLILKYCDRFMLMNSGKLQIFQNAKDMLKAIHHGMDFNLKQIKSPDNLNESLFSLENLHYNVNGKKILKGINYTFKKGGKYVITGSNGSGKTTLLNLIAGFYRPSSGKIISAFKKGDFSNVGVVLQNPNYQLFMSCVREELEFQSKSSEFLSYLIEEFSLKNILDRHPHSLSEGQKRRLGVAMILSMKPDVLILDEPSVGQDFKNMKSMINAVSKLCDEKELTVISVSHDLRCYSFLGDIFLELRDGKIV